MKGIKTVALLAATALGSSSAFAQTAPASGAPDLSSLTSAVDFSTVAPAILTAGAAGIGMGLAWVGVKYVRKVLFSS